jgi:predicted RNase H-related nuclease YkuK (DUF458 family)
MWLDPKGNFKDFSEIVNKIDNVCEVFVGSDSQLLSDSWMFATVVCLYWPGRGGTYFFTRDKKEKSSYASLGDRLMSEVYSSVMIADQIRQLRPDLKINVHADIGSCPTSKSNKFAKLAESYIKGMGFNPSIKPDAWAAAAVADKLTR